MKEYDFLEFCSFLQKKGKIEVETTKDLSLRGYIRYISSFQKDKQPVCIGKLLPCTAFITFVIDVNFFNDKLINGDNLYNVCEIHIQQKGSSIVYVLDGSYENDTFLATTKFRVTRKYFSDKEIFEKGKKMIDEWLYNKPKTRIKKNKK